MRSLLLASVSANMLLTACSAAPQTPAAASTAPVASVGKLTLLSASYSKTNEDALRALPGDEPDGNTGMSMLRDACAANAPPPPGGNRIAFLAPVVTALIGAVFDYAATWVSNALQDEIKKYTQTYKAETPGFFYVATAGGANSIAQGGQSFGAAIGCLRFTRMQKDSDKPALDVIAQLKIEEGGQFFQVRPLRLYFAQTNVPAIAAGEQDTVSVAMELSANAVWREGFSSKTAAAFDSVVMTQKYSLADIKSGKVTYFYNDAKAPANGFLAWSTRPYLPLPPVSTDGNKAVVTSPGNTETMLAGPLNIAVSMTEVGTPPSWLQMLADATKAEGSNVAKGLASAIETQLGLQANSSGSGSGGSKPSTKATTQ